MRHHSKCSHALHPKYAHSLHFSSCLVVSPPRTWNCSLLCWSKQTILQHFCHSDQSNTVRRYCDAGCRYFPLDCEPSLDQSALLNSLIQRSAMRRMRGLWSSSNHQSSSILVGIRLYLAEHMKKIVSDSFSSGTLFVTRSPGNPFCYDSAVLVINYLG